MIVGGGLVGALWAVILAKRGYEVDVYESRPDFRQAGYIGGRSINLALSERGWKAIGIAGIRSQVEAVAIPMAGRMMHGLDGALTFQPYGKEGQAIYSVSRGGLNVELVKIADQHEKVRFHFNQKCMGVDLAKNLVHFVDTQTDAKYAVEADLVFGTDGAFSAVRNSMMRLPRFNYSQQYIGHGYKELSIPPGEGGKHQLGTGALHIWPRGQFMLIALPNLDGSFTCTLFLPYEGTDSFQHLQKEEEVSAFFNRFFPDVVPLMPHLVQDFFENPTSALATVRCSPWHHQHRVLLIGDACHAIVPFFGQGMNAGFEDCTILNDLMDRYQEDWHAIMEDFSANRPVDANAIADLALANFIEMRDKVADPRFLLWKRIEQHLAERYPAEFQSVYAMVSFSHIPYSMALAAISEQEGLFRKMLAIEGIENEWKTAAIEQVFEEWIRQQA